VERIFFQNRWFTLAGVRFRQGFSAQNVVAATVPSYLLKVGTIPISVSNPKPHEFADKGATSNAVNFIVKFALGG